MNEERWISIGLSDIGKLFVVIHTYAMKNNEESVRLISARKACKNEEKMYYNRIKE
jgi:uncharacterized DUF497 family protein